MDHPAVALARFGLTGISLARAGRAALSQHWRDGRDAGGE
jgi:hypothetical protein